MLRQILRAATDLILPPACAACHAPLGPFVDFHHTRRLFVCSECTAMLEPLDQTRCCPRCGSSPRVKARAPEGRCRDCQELPDCFTQARSAFPYDSPAGNIVRNMKYHSAPWLADTLIDLSLGALAGWFPSVVDGATLCPVPLAGTRELRRGFNQATALAEALSARCGSPVLASGVLIRRRATAPQARFRTRVDRLDNLSGAFAVEKPGNVVRRKILLIDDVMTTGATVASAAQALTAAGAASVIIFTPVRARMGRDNPLLDPMEG